ncbi:MAG: helix-turn-helix domain-containing protein [Candidatus Dojkabacteria bacterium]
MYNRTIGERLKSEREKLWLGLDEISNATKINKKYLVLIESNEFSDFTSHAQAIGFIKNYSKFLNIDSANLIAIYKRDFEAVKTARKITTIDDEELEKIKKEKERSINLRFKLTSKGLFGLVAATFIVIFIVLTISFVRNAFEAPYFKIETPVSLYNGETKNYSTSAKTIKITGETVGYTLIKLNEVPLILSPGFTFESNEIPITSENTKLVITAESQLGVKSESILNIVREDIARLNGKKELKIATQAPGVFIKATGDDLVQYNDIATPGVALSFSFTQNGVIETDKYTSVTVTFNGRTYILKSNLQRFSVNSNGELVEE